MNPDGDIWEARVAPLFLIDTELFEHVPIGSKIYLSTFLIAATSVCVFHRNSTTIFIPQKNDYRLCYDAHRTVKINCAFSHLVAEKQVVDYFEKSLLSGAFIISKVCAVADIV